MKRYQTKLHSALDAPAPRPTHNHLSARSAILLLLNVSRLSNAISRNHDNGIDGLRSAPERTGDEGGTQGRRRRGHRRGDGAAHYTACAAAHTIWRSRATGGGGRRPPLGETLGLRDERRWTQLRQWTASLSLSHARSFTNNKFHSLIALRREKIKMADGARARVLKRPAGEGGSERTR